MNLLGIDVGTTAVKAVLFDHAAGRELGTATVEYPLISSCPGGAEVAPETYFQAMKRAIADALKNSGTRDCTALAISSQGETFILLDSRGRPLRDAIVWLDRRSAPECAEIEAEFSRETLYHTTGDPAVDPAWLGTKLRHLRKHEPEKLAAATHILLLEDYLVFRLTGECRGNGALWCSTLLYDICRRDYWPRMLDYLEIGRELLPVQQLSGWPVGPVRKAVAAELGFLASPLVVSGGMDQACSALGSGNFHPGAATNNTGTSFNLSVTADRPVFDRNFRLPCQLHVIDGAWLCVPWSGSGGILLRWFRDALVPEWAEKLRGEGSDFYSELTTEGEKSPPGANGVVVLPHLSGALCPELDADARGVIYGLSSGSTRGDVARAMLEAVSCMARSNLELLADAGVEVRELILTGGAAHSRLWNRITASITGIPARTLLQPEAGCLGAAMLAGIGTGCFQTPEEAAAAMTAVGEHFRPEPDIAAAGERTYRIYRKLYEQLRTLFKESACHGNEA